MVGWSAIALIAICTLWLLWRFGQIAIQGVRQGRIDLEAIIGFVGVVLAAAFESLIIMASPR